MSKVKVKKEKAPSPRKEMRKQIADQLQHALNGSLSEKLGKKEFESRIKKAAKLLSAGIKIKPVKEKKEAAESAQKPE